MDSSRVSMSILEEAKGLEFHKSELPPLRSGVTVLRDVRVCIRSTPKEETEGSTSNAKSKNMMYDDCGCIGRFLCRMVVLTFRFVPCMAMLAGDGFWSKMKIYEKKGRWHESLKITTELSKRAISTACPS
jgi:hypothetical protein